MTPNEAFDIYGRGYMDEEDFIQDCYLAVLEYPAIKEEVLYKEVAKRHRQEFNRHFQEAPHLYNDEGECIDDDIYLVDYRTVEERGVREFNKELKEKGLMLAKIIRSYHKLFKQVFTGSYHKSDTFLKKLRIGGACVDKEFIFNTGSHLVSFSKRKRKGVDGY